jgi:hypothetical protein
VEYGPTCIFPQIEKIPPYHNNAIWPFVVSYWTWAASKAENETAVEKGMDAIYRAAALFLTNKENMVAESGHFDGTEINSDRMLWSIAGNLATVYRIMFGINLKEEGAEITPFVPEKYGGNNKLTNFVYRNASLDITIYGYGTKIKKATIDGEDVAKVFLPKEIAGKHVIEIYLDNESTGGKINLVKNHFAPATPVLKIDANELTWQKDSNADHYIIYQNGNRKEVVKGNVYKIVKENIVDEFSVSAVDKKGYESFISEPINTVIKGENKLKPLNAKLEKEINGFSGLGYVRTTTTENSSLNFINLIESDGYYWIDFKYANGNGPINTYNACGIRTLFINDKIVSTIVLPQRGENNWNNWGYSNSILAFLYKGKSSFRLEYLPINSNMNIKKNEALIDYLRLIPVNKNIDGQL